MRCVNCEYCNKLNKSMNGSTLIFVIDCVLYGEEIIGEVTDERESDDSFCPIMSMMDEKNRRIKYYESWDNSESEGVGFYSLDALRSILETAIVSFNNLEKATNFSFKDYEEMKVNNRHLLEDNIGLKLELENRDAVNTCMEFDNLGYMSFMNHVGVQSIRDYSKDRFKEYTGKCSCIPEEDFRYHYYKGLCDAYSEILEFINEDTDVPRRIEE